MILEEDEIDGVPPHFISLNLFCFLPAQVMKLDFGIALTKAFDKPGCGWRVELLSRELEQEVFVGDVDRFPLCQADFCPALLLQVEHLALDCNLPNTFSVSRHTHNVSAWNSESSWIFPVPEITFDMLSHTSLALAAWHSRQEILFSSNLVMSPQPL